MKRAVVTGGAGFIGSHLVERLAADGFEVLVLDDFSSGRDRLRFVEAAGARVEQADISEVTSLRPVESFRPDLIFNLAAQMSVSRSVKDPVFDANVNIVGMLRMLEAARAGSARFINVSSGGAMYGEITDGMHPFSEDYVGRPASPYGISKKISDDYLRFYERAHGVKFVNIAPANVYGPRQDPHGEAGVVAIFSNRLLSGETCVIYGDGKQTRDFVFVSDVVSALTAVVGRGTGETFNIGSGHSTTVEELYWKMASVVGVTSPPRNEAARPGDAYRMALDVSKAKEFIDWEASVPLDEGLRITIDSFR